MHLVDKPQCMPLSSIFWHSSTKQMNGSVLKSDDLKRWEKIIINNDPLTNRTASSPGVQESQVDAGSPGTPSRWRLSHTHTHIYAQRKKKPGSVARHVALLSDFGSLRLSEPDWFRTWPGGVLCQALGNLSAPRVELKIGTTTYVFHLSKDLVTLVNYSSINLDVKSGLSGGVFCS